MDGTGFDRWAMALAGSPTRRSALRLLGLVGLAGVMGHTSVEAKKHKKKKKKKGGGGSPPGSPPPAGGCGSCGPCTECQGGTCVTQADNTACNSGSGLCGNGTCNLPPICRTLGTPCTPFSTFECCGNGFCTPDGGGATGRCLTQGGTGAACLGGSDCRSGICGGFRCAPAAPCTPGTAGTPCGTDADGVCLANGTCVTACASQASCPNGCSCVNTRSPGAPENACLQNVAPCDRPACDDNEQCAQGQVCTQVLCNQTAVDLCLPACAR
jgi:hypothetical protein